MEPAKGIRGLCLLIFRCRQQCYSNKEYLHLIYKRFPQGGLILIEHRLLLFSSSVGAMICSEDLAIVLLRGLGIEDKLISIRINLLWGNRVLLKDSSRCALLQQSLKNIFLFRFPYLNSIAADTSKV